MIWTVAKKELRGYFNSAVALIFLAAFLVGTLYTFFWHEKFFARGLADMRPFFEWMPILLILLVSALAMRMWAEERRTGTLEILLTLPVPRWKLVAGKFVAGLLLIAIALALTLGVPVTVARMGDLDLGPVVGGYLATMLLAAAYLVIGMCISALTDIQIVAFVGTLCACAVTYVIGGAGDIGRAFGTGARFESVARGVIDLRDLAYYGSIVCVGISLNVLLLGQMTWGRSARARRRRFAAVVTLALILANSFALGVWLAPVRRARIDITQDGAYSLSPATVRVIQAADERILIRGYFSKTTHPELEPLVPQIKDLLEEYRLVGGGKVRVEILDPTDDDAAKRDAKDRFDIEPDLLQFATQTQQSVVNAYFAIAIEYGNQHAVLKLRDLIQERAVDSTRAEVTLKNPEYEITKSIKKAVTGFASIEALFAKLPGKVKLTTFITPKSLPENWKDADVKLKTVVDDLNKETGGKLEFTVIEPKTEEEMVAIIKEHNVRPYMDLGVGKPYFFHLVLDINGKTEAIVPPENLGDAAIRTALIDGLKRAAPGFTRVVGIWVPPAGPPINIGGQFREGMPAPQTFQKLRESLTGNYEVRDVPLTVAVPNEIEVLLLCGPANLDAKAVEAVDQFVMRGGALVVLAGRYRFAVGEQLALEKVTTGLEPMLAAWGITTLDQLVMDPKAEVVPVPREKVINGTTVQEVAPIPFPFFVKLAGKQLASSVITSGVPGAVMHFPAPVDAKEQVGDDKREVDILLSSSSDAWLTTSLEIDPDLDKYPETGFPPGTDPKSYPLAVSVVGGFPTSLTVEKGSGAKRVNEHSPANTRVAVFGSSAFVTDAIYSLARRLNWDLALSNITLVHNTIDWALADTDLLEIRARSSSSHALTVPEGSRSTWRIVNVVIAFALLGVVVAIAILRRRAVKPVVTKEAA